MKGSPTDMTVIPSWIHTDTRKGVVYVNVNSRNRHIFRIGPLDTGRRTKSRVWPMANGYNEEGILLWQPVRFSPVDPDDSVPMEEGMALLEEILQESLPCSPPDIYFVISWLIAIFLADFALSRPLFCISGSIGSGKTVSARIINSLVTGNSYLAPSSLISCDFEKTPLLGFDGFRMAKPLMLATEGSMGKETGPSPAVEEITPKGMILFTSSEPYAHSSLTRRSLILHLFHRFKRNDFNEAFALKRALGARTIILTSILEVIAVAVLPILRGRPPMPFIDLMMIILDGVWKYLCIPMEVHEVKEAWSRMQSDFQKGAI